MEVKLYIWTIPSQYGGYDIGYIRETYILVLAESLDRAKETAMKKITDFVYPSLLEQIIQKIIREENPVVHYNGEVEMF